MFGPNAGRRSSCQAWQPCSVASYPGATTLFPGRRRVAFTAGPSAAAAMHIIVTAVLETVKSFFRSSYKDCPDTGGGNRLYLTGYEPRQHRLTTGAGQCGTGRKTDFSVTNRSLQASECSSRRGNIVWFCTTASGMMCLVRRTRAAGCAAELRVKPRSHGGAFLTRRWGVFRRSEYDLCKPLSCLRLQAGGVFELRLKDGDRPARQYGS